MSLGLCPANIPMTWDIRCNHSDVPADHVHVDEVSRQTGRQASKQASRPAGQQASRQAGREASRETGKSRQGKQETFPETCFRNRLS